MEQKKPKFEVGQEVSMSRPTLYGESKGVITQSTKLFKCVRKVYADGRSYPEHNGLVQEERHIDSICLPHRFDGNTLEVDHPQSDYGTFIQKAFTAVYEFYGYAYTVKTEKINTVYSERQLRKI